MVYISQLFGVSNFPPTIADVERFSPKRHTPICSVGMKNGRAVSDPA